jgi:DNA-binding YbaB/EbfC family protein
MLGGLKNMGKLMKQAQKFQKKMKDMQNDLADRVVEGTAGGGMVKAQVNGAQEIVSIKIDPEVIDPEDAEMLEDMVTAAVSQAVKKAKELHETEMKKLTGEMGIPPGFF